MSETIEHAREGLEHAEHAPAHHSDRTARRIAVLIAVSRRRWRWPTWARRGRKMPT